MGWFELAKKFLKVIFTFGMSIPADIRKRMMKKIFGWMFREKKASDVANEVSDAFKPVKKPDPTKKEMDETAKKVTDFIDG